MHNQNPKGCCSYSRAGSGGCVEHISRFIEMCASHLHGCGKLFRVYEFAYQASLETKGFLNIEVCYWVMYLGLPGLHIPSEVVV